MTGFWLTQLEYIVRLLIACACGIGIGYERQNRLKVAGVRTHLIVALGATLMMIVSKYGFADLIGTTGVGLDPSRIAAQIVSGVGFLGVGIIFVRKGEVSGLTTAAGLWATAGVGMALGAGQYVIGIVAAILIILVQIILHKNLKLVQPSQGEKIHFELAHGEQAMKSIEEQFAVYRIEVLNVKANRLPDDKMEVDFFVKLPNSDTVNEMLRYFRKNPDILSLKM